MDSIERAEDGRLIELLGLHRVGPGHDRVREIAAVRVGGVEAPDAAAVRTLLAAFTPQAFAQRLAGLADVNVFALIAATWGQVLKVHDALARSRAEPQRPVPVELPRHTLEAKLKPSLVLSVGGVDWCHIHFEFTVKLKLVSATLQLQAGRLAAVQFVGAELGLSLGCEGNELREFRRDLHLAPELTFSPPLALSRDAAAVAGRVDSTEVREPRMPLEPPPLAETG